jgi:predicted secreted protein
MLGAMAKSFKRGEIFTHTLSENLSTGYSWKLIQADGDEAVVELISIDRVTRPGNAEGRGGHAAFKFKAIRSGTFELVYVPPGRDATPDKVQSYTIVVDGVGVEKTPSYFAAVAVIGATWLFAKFFGP